METLYIEEVYVNRTRNARIGESGVYETFTHDAGKLFRHLQQDFGRCTGKLFVDLKDGTAQQRGWVFEKREKYQDDDETYLQETWVTVHDAPPTKTTQYHYHNFAA